MECMADLKENDMTVRNAEYLRCLDYAGNSGIVKNIQNTIGKIGTTVDCNEMKEEGRCSSNLWKNAPMSTIAILEVIRYSGDWIVQKFYVIPTNGTLPIYVRSFYNGNTWSAWKKLI